MRRERALLLLQNGRRITGDLIYFPEVRRGSIEPRGMYLHRNVIRCTPDKLHNDDQEQKVPEEGGGGGGGRRQNERAKGVVDERQPA